MRVSSANGMVLPCSCAASEESGKGLQRQGARHVSESQQSDFAVVGISKPHEAQFVGVARDIDGDDPARTLLERHRVDRAVLLAQHEPRQAVDAGNTGLGSRQRGVLAGNSGQEAQNLVGPVDGIVRRGWPFTSTEAGGGCLFY
jgi:hypothetical protein